MFWTIYYMVTKSYIPFEIWSFIFSTFFSNCSTKITAIYQQTFRCIAGSRLSRRAWIQTMFVLRICRLLELLFWCSSSLAEKNCRWNISWSYSDSIECPRHENIFARKLLFSRHPSLGIRTCTCLQLFYNSAEWVTFLPFPLHSMSLNKYNRSMDIVDNNKNFKSILFFHPDRSIRIFFFPEVLFFTDAQQTFRTKFST